MWIISTILHHSCVPRLWMTGILKAPHNLAELQILGFRDYHILIIFAKTYGQNPGSSLILWPQEFWTNYL